MATKTPKKILIVEDETDIAQLVKLYLEKDGFRTTIATTGAEGLKQIKSDRPDMVILDLMLPEMDGFEVVHRLSLNPDWREIPVILLTARDLSHEERRALDMGTSRIIQKGNYSRDELLAELRVVTGATALALPEDAKS